MIFARYQLFRFDKPSVSSYVHVAKLRIHAIITIRQKGGNTMAIDGLILHQITAQIQDHIPAKITKIQQLSDTEVIFIVRGQQGTQRLMISTHSVYNRINMTDAKYTTLETPGNFIMLLRKQMDGGIIKSIQQIGLDRILHFEIEARDELGDIHQKHLYIELMGKYANMVLVDEDGRIIDAMKRIPPFENNKRTIHPGAMFVLPAPHEHKKDPFTNQEYQLEESFTKQFHGFSPLLSNEIQYRLYQKEDFSKIMKSLASSKSMFISDVQDGMQFHCIPLTHLEAPIREYPLMKGIDILYGEKEEKIRIKQQSGDLFRVVKKELHKNTSKLPKLNDSLAEAMDCEKYRICGDLLFAYMGQIEKQKTIVLPSFEDESEISIDIDMRYDLKQNANKYYQKYHKAKRAQSILQEQIDLCEKEVRYFEAMQLQLEQATMQDALEIRDELTKQNYMKAQVRRIRKKKNNEVPHYETFVFGELKIYVGKNNLQNDYVTWKLGRKQDTWLHAKDLHGAHVVITTDQPDEETLRNAAMLAAWYSTGRYSSSVPINYCELRQLKKIPGNKGSFVSLSTYKTIYIDPDPQHIQFLLDEHLQP